MMQPWRRDWRGSMWTDRPWTSRTCFPEVLHINADRTAVLRYGENPHQQAALYSFHNGGIAGAKQLHGKELSYNNLVDLDAAWQLVIEFNAPAAAIIKHTNPCGCAERETLAGAYLKALEADPVSAFGGVLAFNQELDEDTAHEVGKLFVEAIAAPAFSPGALSTLQSKKNLRLVLVDPLVRNEAIIRSIGGGLLAQTPDRIPFDFSSVQVKTKRAPTPEEQRALTFGWKIAKHVKSNAIVYARPGQTISVGAGQMSRVDSVKVGAMKAVLPLNGTVIASDAFFPFPDGIEEAARHGITAVIQPGGSVRDEEDGSRRPTGSTWRWSLQVYGTSGTDRRALFNARPNCFRTSSPYRPLSARRCLKKRPPRCPRRRW